MSAWCRGLGRTERRPVGILASGSMLALDFPVGFFASGILSGMGALFTEVFPTEPVLPDTSGQAPHRLSGEARP